MQQDGRQNEFAGHLRIGDLQRAAIGAMNRIVQAIRGSGMQEVLRAVEITGMHLQPKGHARRTQEQKASDKLVIANPRRKPLVGQYCFDGFAGVQILKHRHIRPRLMF